MLLVMPGNQQIEFTPTMAFLLCALGIGSPRFPADAAILAAMTTGPVVTPAAATTTVEVGRAPGAKIATVLDPFAAFNVGPTKFAVVGNPPGQLALNGRDIVVGAAALVANASYQITVQATSGDGKQTVTGTTTVNATGAITFSASSPPGTLIANWATLFPTASAGAGFTPVGEHGMELQLSAQGVALGPIPAKPGNFYSITLQGLAYPGGVIAPTPFSFFATP